ncbi:MAG TPA: glycosyltransferase family 39 protein [Acidimicrobiia bacterium]|nr:glycosyltransferase family 39 protein [Acidimicrobiia bacterium]
MAGLFFCFVTRSNLWLDEALSVNIARLPLGDLHQALKHDGAPPLFYLLLHVWTGSFGTSMYAVRALSGLCVVGAAVAMWFAGRRLGGDKLAWLAVFVLFTNPYAFRYATETRMYALEILLVTLGLLAFQRTLDRPSWGRAACFGLVVAALVYTQYWTFFLLPVVGVLLIWMLWRDVHRVAAWRLLIAGGVGVLTFLPWVPTFLYQNQHTGTPWGTPILPGIPLAYTLRDFAGGASGTQADRQEGWLLFFVLVPLLLLGLFARGVDKRKIEVDLAPRREIRGIAFVGGVGLVVALFLNYLGGGAFQSRYSAIVFPFFVLIIARGLTTLLDTRVLIGVLVVAALLGWAGGVRNVVTQRTQAGTVANVLKAEAKPGDVVVYCPDQLGPGVHRLVQKGLDEFTFPRFESPAFVDWVDYKKRVKQEPVQDFASRALARANGKTLWYVTAPGYTTHAGICEALTDAFAKARPLQPRTTSDDHIFEKPALTEFPSARTG